MTERERIQQLVDDGKISQEEADLLFDALDEVDEADATVDSGPTPDASPDAPSPGAPPMPPEPPAAPPAPTINAPGTDKALRWVRVELLAGSLDATVDPSLSEPKPSLKGKGDIDIERNGDDWKVSVRGPRQAWLGNVFSHDLHVDLRLPQGFGLELDAKAGQVKARGVPHLRGKMLAGDVQAFDLGGLDLEMKAGTLDASMRLTEGRHRLDMKAGTANITLLKGSDVRVEGDVKAGALSLAGPFEQQSRIAGASFKGTLGAGRAQLTVNQKAGTLDLEVERE